MVPPKFVILIIITILVSSQFSRDSRAAANLAGSEWRPIEIEGVAVKGASEIFLQFRDGDRVTGHGGCNRFFGSFKLDGDRIEFGPFGTTQMMCPQPVINREKLFLNTLERTATFIRDRIHLSLFNAAGNVVLKLIQTDPD